MPSTATISPLQLRGGTLNELPNLLLKATLTAKASVIENFSQSHGLRTAPKGRWIGS